MRVQGDLISKKYASGQPVLVVSSGLNESRDVGGRQADVEPVAAICAVCDRDPGPLRVKWAYARSGADSKIDWLVFWADIGGEVVVALLALCERYVESWLTKRKAWN